MSTILEELIQPGNKLSLFYGDSNINNSIFHVVAIVDEDQVVIKKWLKHKKYWSYSVKSFYWFQLNIDKLTLKR